MTDERQPEAVTSRLLISTEFSTVMPYTTLEPFKEGS